MCIDPANCSGHCSECQDSQRRRKAWRNMLYGEGSNEHIEGCPNVAMTCAACEREIYEDGARAAIDTYLAARGDARLAERERCLSIVRCQPYYPDTHTGKRQQWVKDEIERKIRAGEGP